MAAYTLYKCKQGEMRGKRQQNVLFKQLENSIQYHSKYQNEAHGGSIEIVKTVSIDYIYNVWPKIIKKVLNFLNLISV